MSDTGLQSPTATGETYNDWTDPSNAFSSDDARATSSTEGNLQDYYGFSPTIPAGVTIDGIEVIAEAADGVAGVRIGVELSWNGGADYTATGKIANVVGGFDSNYTFGGPSDTWGRVWSGSEFSDSTFRLKLEYLTDLGGGVVGVDHIQVRIYYTEGSDEGVSSFRAAPPDDNALEAPTKDILYGTDAQSLKELGNILINYSFTNPSAPSPAQLIVTIAHNLGYEPLFRVFFRPRPDRNEWFSDTHLRNSIDTAINPESADKCLAQADENNVYVALTGYFGNTYQAKLYVFMDDAR